MKKNFKRIGIVAILLLLNFIASAQNVENEYQIRSYGEFRFEPIENLKLNVIPEIRLDEKFSVDEYLLEGEAEYDLFKFLSVGATYRFEINPRETKSTEYFHRYSFNTKLEKDFNRFESSFRLRYSNYADDEITDKSFLRYKAKLDYDIRNFKLTPSVAVEAFQDLSENNLFKMRYTAGFDYKLFKKNFLSVDYKFDYYNQQYKNRHIFSVGYKIKF